MINLLPEPERKKLRREYFFRLATVCFTLAAFVLAIGAVSLLPTLFYSDIKVKALKENTSSLTEAAKREQGGDSGQLLLATTEKLNVLAADRKNAALEEVFARITAAKPSDTRLTGFAVERQEGDKNLLLVRGVAVRRGDLAAFAKALGQEKDFTTVSFPISDLTQNENLDFSLTITASF